MRGPELNALWHPFADMGAVDGARLVIARGEGPWVFDENGTRYLDGTAALWYANLGHGRREIADAVTRQMRELDAYSIFGDFANAPALELADRLAALMPGPGAKVFLGSGGGDAIDTAAKIARRHFAELGQPDRVHLIGRGHGYHGTHGIGTSIGGIPANLAGFGPMLEHASSVPHDDAAALEAEIVRVGPDRVAAFFCEPVIGAGGVHLPPDGYLETVAEICARQGVLFVADCVICAFGRLGTWLGIDRWPVTPDMVTIAKGVTSGTLPLGAVLVTAEVAAPFFPGQAGAPVLRHGPTYAGHPACCAAALAALDLYERDDVIARGRELEEPLAAALAPLAGHDLVGEVRSGTGFLAGIEFDADALAAEPGLPGRLQFAVRERGVLVRPLGRGVAVSPPLVCGQQEIGLLAGALADGLAAL